MNFVKKIYKNNKYSYLIMVIFLFSFLFGSSVNATVTTWIQGNALDILATFVYAIVATIGKLIGVVVGIMKTVAGYNGFINSEPVMIGWEIIRDLCNMGFVIVLLIIAIASILRIESYSYRTWLPKLVIMAILINFSKMIAGVLIDASQIVMLTFVSGIASIREGNFYNILGVNQYLSFGTDFSDEFKAMHDKGTRNDVDALNIAGTIILALVVTLIALVVLTAITIVLIIRIVALWILVILSPFAYLFSASPAGHKYASKWWQKFSQWVTTGPVMMFFIWLSLATMKSTVNSVVGEPKTSDNVQAGLAAIGTPAVMGAFLLGSIMLMASLIVAQQLGGMASKVAGGAYNMISSRGDRMMKMPGRALSKTWSGTKVGADYLNRKSALVFGTPDLNLGRIKQRFGGAMAEGKRKELNKMQSIANEKGGSGEGMAGYTKAMLYGPSNLEERLSFKSFGSSVATSTSAAWKGMQNVGITADGYGGYIDDIDAYGEEFGSRGHIKKRKELEKQKENEQKKLDNIISRSEYTNRAAGLRESGDEIDKEIDDNEELKGNLNTEIQGLDNSIESLANTLRNTSESSVRYDGKEVPRTVLEEKQKELTADKKQKEEKLNMVSGSLDERRVEKQKNEDEQIKFRETFKSKMVDDATAKKEREKIKKSIEKIDSGIKKARKKEASTKIDNYAIRRYQEAQLREEESKITTTDSGELMAGADIAMENGEIEKSKALISRLFKNKDFNDILARDKYAYGIGFTEKEVDGYKAKINKLKEEGLMEEAKFYEKKLKNERGMNDWFRDVYRKKLGVSKQEAYAFQSDMASIAKANADTALTDSVKIKDGSYAQLTKEEHNKAALAHSKKTSDLNLYRSGGRSTLGGEDANGDFYVHATGLQRLMSGYKTLDKTIKEGRFSDETAVKLTEEGNMKILRNAALTMKREEREGFTEMLDNLTKHANSIRGLVSDTNDIVEHRSSIIDDTKKGVKIKEDTGDEESQ